VQPDAEQLACLRHQFGDLLAEHDAPDWNCGSAFTRQRVFKFHQLAA